MRTTEHFLAVFFLAVALALLALLPFGAPVLPTVAAAALSGAYVLLVGLRWPPGV